MKGAMHMNHLLGSIDPLIPLSDAEKKKKFLNSWNAAK
jgi:hypothetical protein